MDRNDSSEVPDYKAVQDTCGYCEHSGWTHYPDRKGQILFCRKYAFYPIEYYTCAKHRKRYTGFDTIKDKEF